jgi:hypothetical protein
MNENKLIETTVSEYRNLFEIDGMKADGKFDNDRLALALSKDHDWTHQGAVAIVCLAKEYGAFMLRNALALAIALEKEDGNMGF